MPNEEEEEMEGDDSTPLPYLPLGIITKILERLPVKSLLRFRSVCKSWRFLISRPNFVKAHTNLSAKNNEFHHLMLSSDMPGFELKCCPLYSVPNKPDAIKLHHSFGTPSPRDTFCVVGSYNGLVCVTIDVDQLYLWNPCTRECKKLPLPDVEKKYRLYDRYGLGYDDFSDEYKVVGVFAGMFDLIHKYQVWVYSVKAGSWRRIRDFPFVELHGIDSVYANGALYWAANSLMWAKCPSHIISLDLRDETYREVVQPTYGEGFFSWSVGALGGSLFVRCYYGNRFDLWLMKEYCGVKSWTKMVSIPYLMSPVEYMCSLPLCISKNGEILLESPMRLMVYNPEDNTLKDCEIHNFRVGYPDSCLFVDTYVESLVSPKTDVELQATLAAIEEIEE